MKKVVLATLLACAAIASGLPSAYAQTAAAPAGAPPCALPDAEYKPYTDAMGQKTPQAMAAAIEAYLTAFPVSACPEYKLQTLATLMQAYSTFDPVKTLDTADRVLQLDPTNFTALLLETALRKGAGDAATDPAAKQAAYDAAAGYAQKGLTAPKPAYMDDATFKQMQAIGPPIFYNAIATAALNKKDTATAIDTFKKELAAVPVAQTQVVPVLQDIYYLALAYYTSAPPDWLDCAFYMARFENYAPEPFKSQGDKTGKYCYKKFHGDEGGYDTFVAAAKNSLTPPDGLFAAVKPAPTPADIINGVFATTPDLTALAPDDREYIIVNGTTDQAGKVWDSVKGKSYQFPAVLVIASTPTQVQVAISSDAVATKTADYTFNLAAPETPAEPEKPSSKATPAQLAAYKAKLAAYNKALKAAQADAAAAAAATAVGQSVTLEGTYDSFTAKPLMIVMSNGSVVLPKAEKPAPKPAPAARRPAPR